MMDESALASGIYENFAKCIALRNKYYSLSLQGQKDIPKDLDAALKEIEASGRPFDGQVPAADSERVFSLSEDGIYTVYANTKDQQACRPIVEIPSVHEFYADSDFISAIAADGPTKTLAFRRMRYIQAQFQIYLMLNEQKESDEQKRAPHRDFYNVRKVDTHIHHSSSMNCKHLLRFIKSKLKKNGNDPVIFRDGKNLTLEEVFQSLNLTAYDLNIDVFDMHAHKDTFHRFDRFNLKYNPVGEGRLREIFLKTDNFIKGRYLAEITKEVMADLESNKYQMVEWRLSIYGRSRDEWDRLAAWVVDNNLYSDNVRWLIQIPRLFEQFKNSKSLNSFEDMLINIFQPLFEVTRDPGSHPKLHHFLKRVVGFDCVDDESKPEKRMHKKVPFPKYWESNANPPYAYYLYYLYANMVSLNHFRAARNYGTFVLRPHSGEAGDPDHLVNAFLLAHGISHGITLRKIPAIQYLYYLTQIGIAMSPLSNNILFLTYDRNPFPAYFQCGLNVSLSTDDPLQFHYTKEPLIEEYSVAAQIYKLSSADMCEIARNSVMQSGFEMATKQLWLGINCHGQGPSANDIGKSNVPNIRVLFRQNLLNKEWAILRKQTGAEEEVIVHSAPIPSNEVVLLKQLEDEIIEAEDLTQVN